MRDPSKQRRLWFVFSLRTLFLVVLALGACLGYEINWVQQRRAFLADQLTRLELSWQGEDENPFKAETIRWWQDIQLTDERPPGYLWLFGETAVGRLLVMIPEKDVRYRDQTYEMRACQLDFRRARQLFPEAEIHPIRWSDEISRDQERAFYEVQIID